MMGKVIFEPERCSKPTSNLSVGAETLRTCGTNQLDKSWKFEPQRPIFGGENSIFLIFQYVPWNFQESWKTMYYCPLRVSWIFICSARTPPWISTGCNFFRRRRRIAKVYSFEKLIIFSFDWCYFQDDSGTFWKPAGMPIINVRFSVAPGGPLWIRLKQSHSPLLAKSASK